MKEMRPYRAALAALLVALAGCAAPPPLAPPPPDATPPPAAFTVLQLNDVYEIAPVEGGASGGLARVATLRARLLAEGAPVLTVLAGDFLSPSALGTAVVDGERLAGAQMVAVLNALGLDAAAVGNHEFDVGADAFAARVAEAAFPFVTANAVRPDGAPFPGVAARLVVPLAVAPGDTVRVGLASVVLPSNQAPWVRYLDADSTLRAEVARLDRAADVVIGLTHQAFADDATAAATIDGLDMVLGGHEHENVRAYRGARFVPVLKADANARTVYVHRVSLDRATGAVAVASELVRVTDAVPDDPAVAAVVDDWVERAYAGFRADGFEPARVVATTTDALDGRESAVRTRPTNLGTLLADGFRRAAGAEVAVMNGGSVRVDDVLTPGPFTEYDAIRVLPFGGTVVGMEVAGEVLTRALEQGLANAGTGGFLQTSGVARRDDGAWALADGTPIAPDRTYAVAANDYLASGRESGLAFFAVGAPGVVETGRHGDVRQVLIDELARVYD